MSEPDSSQNNARTLATYEAAADVYAAAQNASPPQGVLDFIDRFAAELRPGAGVLEIGSATGQDADLLEQRGLCVQRSDATSAFVTALRARGHRVELVNVITDELAGPWDAIYANAVFLHLSAAELAAVLSRTAAAVLPGGLLAFTLKEGDGEGWSSHKLSRPRHFTYWRALPLRRLLDASPWELISLSHEAGRKDDWLQCICRAAR